MDPIGINHESPVEGTPLNSGRYTPYKKSGYYLPASWNGPVILTRVLLEGFLIG
jgi:hypothetical protein